MLWKEEETSFDQNQFELDCSKIVLKSNDPALPSIEGVGSIFQKTNGWLYFKVYATVPHVWKLLGQLQGAVKAGQLIPNHVFYEFEALDSQNRLWKNSRVRFDFNSSSTNFTILTGTLESITYQYHPPIKPIDKPYIKLRFYQSVKIPSNNFTEKSISVANKESSSSSELNIWKFESNNCEFLLRQEKDCLYVICRHHEQAPLPLNFETRLVETLQFITGERLRWSHYESGNKNLIEVTLRSKPPKLSATRLLPPIQYNLITNINETQKLFSLYLQHTLKDASPDWHPISQNHYSILNGSDASISAEALTLGVEIEGLAKNQLSNYHPKPPSQESLALASEKIESLEIDVEIKKRIAGFIGSMTGIKGQNILRRMAEEKIITDEQFANWKKLRNPAAHCDPFDSSKFQIYIDACHANTVLFYHLVFHLIGYQGIYTNYARHGFPEAVYNPSIAENQTLS